MRQIFSRPILVLYVLSLLALFAGGLLAENHKQQHPADPMHANLSMTTPVDDSRSMERVDRRQ